MMPHRVQYAGRRSHRRFIGPRVGAHDGPGALSVVRFELGGGLSGTGTKVALENRLLGRFPPQTRAASIGGLFHSCGARSIRYRGAAAGPQLAAMGLGNLSQRPAASCPAARWQPSVQKCRGKGRSASPSRVLGGAQPRPKFELTARFLAFTMVVNNVTFPSALSSHFPDGRATLPGPQPFLPVRLGFPIWRPRRLCAPAQPTLRCAGYPPRR